MNTALELQRLRAVAHRFILGALWVHVPLIVGLAFILGRPLPFFGLTSLALPLVVMTTFRVMPEGSTARVTEGIALMASVSLLVGVLAGQKVQVDMHMYYFAALALLVANCDWRVILGGAATVAIHHILLNFLLSSFVYSGGPDFLRLTLHAVVLILEAGALAWMAFTLEATFNGLAAESDRTRAAHAAS